MEQGKTCRLNFSPKNLNNALIRQLARLLKLCINSPHTWILKKNDDDDDDDSLINTLQSESASIGLGLYAGSHR